MGKVIYTIPEQSITVQIDDSVVDEWKQLGPQQQTDAAAELYHEDVEHQIQWDYQLIGGQ